MRTLLSPIFHPTLSRSNFTKAKSTILTAKLRIKTSPHFYLDRCVQTTAAWSVWAITTKPANLRSHWKPSIWALMKQSYQPLSPKAFTKVQLTRWRHNGKKSDRSQPSWALERIKNASRPEIITSIVSPRSACKRQRQRVALRVSKCAGTNWLTHTVSETWNL